jgi:hypothetical protein
MSRCSWRWASPGQARARFSPLRTASGTRNQASLFSGWFKGTFREPAASGAVAIEGENLTPGAAGFSEIFRATQGSSELVRTRD